MAVYVGRWDCKYCGYKGVLGPEKECSNCGADRPKDVRFYMADENDIVQDPEVLKRAKSGPDWRCSYCENNNTALQVVCTSCGNPKNTAQGDKQLDVREYKTEEVPWSGDYTKKVEEVAAPIAAPKKKVPKGCLVALAIFVIAAIFFSQSRQITVTVAGFEWERTIPVQENRKVIEEDWQVPSGGTQLESFRAIHHYDQILDHYETRTRTQQRAVGTEEYVCGKRDLGNGYFEDKYCTRTVYESYEEEYQEPIYRDEPVYQTKYRYSIYRWLDIKPIVTKGKNHQAEWGNVVEIQTNANLREGNRKGVYTVVVKDDDAKLHQEELPEQQWKNLEIGMELKAKEGLIGDYRGLDKEALKEAL